MSKGSKEALTVLLITVLIFNQFSICKKFWKAETKTFPTIPSNVMYVKGVESYFEFWPLWHASTYIALADMVGKVLVSAFQNVFRIENHLNIKKVMIKSVKASFDPFDMLWVKVLWALTGYFGGARGHFIQSTLSTLSTWVRWVTLLYIQYCVKTTNTTFDPFDMSNN